MEPKDYPDDSSILFKPISAQERLSHPRAMHPTEALPPIKPGQPYCVAYSSKQQPRPAVAPSPSSFTPAAFSPAVFPGAPMQPLYPGFSSVPGAGMTVPRDAAKSSRIASTFAAGQPYQGVPGYMPETTSHAPENLLRKQSALGQETLAREPLYSAAPSKGNMPEPHSSISTRGRAVPTGVPPGMLPKSDTLLNRDKRRCANTTGAAGQERYCAPPAYQPHYPVRDEIAAFFSEPFNQTEDFTQRQEYYSVPSFQPARQADDAPDYYAGYEMESLSEAAEPPYRSYSFEEITDGPAALDFKAANEAAGQPRFEFFDHLDSFDANGPQKPPEEAKSPPVPAYTPARPAYRKKAAAQPSKAGRTSAGRASNPQPMPHQTARPPIRWGRVAALAAAACMLVFCAVVGGTIVFRMSTNERVMRQVKEAYQEQMGGSLMDDASRVELPSVGVTFVPEITAAPMVTPVPTSRVTIADPAADSLNPRQSADVQATEQPAGRARLKRYPNNTLCNVLDSMKAINSEYPDVIGKLTIPGVLNEVVVQRNNTYYLNHNHRGVLMDGGAVYADESCSIKTPPENLLLRGQGNVAGKAFEALWQYQTGGQSFVSGADVVKLTTLYEEAEYKLLAVVVADSDPASQNYFNFASYPTFATDEQMMSFVENAMRLSLYRFNVSVVPEDRLLTLATVSSAGSTQSLVLIFRMLRNGESGQ